MPKFGNGHIIITTRQIIADSIELENFSLEESVEFFMKRTKSNDKETAQEIAKSVYGMPQWLEKAAVISIRFNPYSCLNLIEKCGIEEMLNADTDSYAYVARVGHPVSLRLDSSDAQIGHLRRWDWTLTG